MEDIQQIICFGAGWVGGITMTFLANQLPNIKFIVYDIDQNLISQWKNNKAPFFEKDLQQYLNNSLNLNLFFTSNISDVLNEKFQQKNQIIFLCINTPSQINTYNLNTKNLEDCLKNIIEYYDKFEIQSNKFVTILSKSTVPVKSCLVFDQVMEQNFKQFPNNIKQIQIIQNPEFLSEGQAIQDLLNPERIVLGSNNNNQYQFQQIVEFYKQVYKNNKSIKIICTNLFSSELGKIVSNCFLAQRISSINSLSQICEQVGADIHELKQILTSDKRIGHFYLEPGTGFGGSCLQKDLQCLIYLAQSLQLFEVAEYWQGVLKINCSQRFFVVKNIINVLKQQQLQQFELQYQFQQQNQEQQYQYQQQQQEQQQQQKVIVLGAAFKNKTCDVRCSQNIGIILLLLQEKLKVVLYDQYIKQQDFIKESIFQKENRQIFVTEQQIIDVEIIQDQFYSKVKDSCAIIILQQFQILQDLDYEQIKIQMKHPFAIFDLKNSFDCQKLKDLYSLGFLVYQLGK